jgi:hypothetical protein
MGQAVTGLITRCEGHINVMKYDKFQSPLINRHKNCEDVMKKIDAMGEVIEFSCLKCGVGTQVKNNFTLFLWGFGHDKNK